jgi:hypothetical protein
LQTAFLILFRLERRRSQVSSIVLNSSFWSMRLPRPPSSRIQPRRVGIEVDRDRGEVANP